MERVPKKRNVISLETKYDIIQKSKEGVTVSKLSKDFNLATSTICTILAEKEKYIQAIEDNALRDRKRLKMSTYPKLEEAMAMWFNQTTNNTSFDITSKAFCLPTCSLYRGATVFTILHRSD